ncbi:hypothetical protein LSH36_838g01010 [Paralvinella palmiformis]|uniref:Uncharacterized protein n=1 Tax=Paralvinella palmiformis TaxID=53620 RepID=A0AAD9MRW0_9ANNE|nr:hypothetical protein LSH36_838g01010 [Paralvinella palmiformis]
METFSLPFWGEFRVSLVLFDKVKNAKEIKQLAMKGDINAALIKPEMISDCFKIFGLDKSDEHLLVAEIHKVDEGTLSTLCSRIQGENIPLSRLKEFTDVGLIKKVYKVTDEELNVGTLLEAAVGRMASKEFVTF